MELGILKKTALYVCRDLLHSIIVPVSSPIFFNSDWGFTLASDWLLTIIKIDADWLLRVFAQTRSLYKFQKNQTQQYNG